LSWGPEGWLDDIAYGVFVTVSLALATLPVGLAIGFLVALAKQSSEPSLRLAGNIYTTIFRGLPELLTLFLVFFGAQIGLQRLFQLFDPGATVNINAFVSGMIALGVVFSSYASEVFLSAFRAIPRGQYEGGYAVGLTNWQTMRLVVLPQLIRIALPGLANLWLILLKDTALVSAVGLSDILRQTIIAARVSHHAFIFFTLACLIYLALSIISSFGINAIERAVSGGEVKR
jgi:polar amino acid transport system permease protein